MHGLHPAAPPSRAPAGPPLAMVAGEASGDLLASLLMRGLAARWPGVTLAGVGGPRMQAMGFAAWEPSERLAVHGLVEAIPVYRSLLALRRELAARILAERVRGFIGVDAPDFNFGLEARLKAQGLPTVHFVSPSIWAWRGGRIRGIRKAVDHMLCLFPFEPAIYTRAGIPATYVGHPLASELPMRPDQAGARRRLGLPQRAPVVALLPGSRAGEVGQLAPRFLRAALQMQAARRDLIFILPAAPGRRAAIEAAWRAQAPQLELRLLDGRSHEALAACDVTLIASGTATLEAALLKRPMVVAYAVHPLTHALMKRLAYLPWIALPNILLRDFAVPELIQNAASPDALARATLGWLDDAAQTEALRRRFEDLHETLRRDTATLATDAIAQTFSL